MEFGIRDSHGHLAAPVGRCHLTYLSGTQKHQAQGPKWQAFSSLRHRPF